MTETELKDLRHQLLNYRLLGETVEWWCMSLAMSEHINAKQANTAIHLLQLDKDAQRKVIIIDDTMVLGSHNNRNYMFNGNKWIESTAIYNTNKDK